MASLNLGKDEVVSWIRSNFDVSSSILDVGACDGKWRKLLPEYENMDAVEVFEPNISFFRLENLYRKVFNADIRNLKYKHYDLIIFGDVIEHMTASDAQAVLKYARRRCNDMVVGVPFLYPQSAIYGNPYERHLQPDLTMKIFNERYEGLKVLVNTGKNYCYFVKE